MFGKASGFPADFQLSGLDGSNGFRISGVAAGDGSGGSVAAAGDLNADGFDDLIVGAPGSDAYGDFTGASYVIFGAAGGFASNLDLGGLNGTNGFALEGVNLSDFTGRSVSGAGDVNGDGFDDLIVGAFGAGAQYTTSAGASYVVFGRDFRDEADFLGTDAGDTHSGTAAGDIVVGGLDRDFLYGSFGNDVLTGGQGSDFLDGSADEDFLRGGTGNDSLDGGTGSDRLEGDGGRDVLDGGPGNDILVGGIDNDRFFFGDALTPDNVDTIMDFGGAGAATLDLILLHQFIFTALGGSGVLAEAAFESGTDAVANSAATRIIYNTVTGNLYYDADGSAAGSAPVLFAVLATDPDALDASDFLII